jgi:hypothetical protein
MTSSTSIDAPASNDETATRGEGQIALKEHESRVSLKGNIATFDRLFVHYPDSVRDDSVWLRAYCATHCNGEHALIAKIAASLGIQQSDNYWYQVLTGRYFRPGGSAPKLKEFITQIRTWSLLRANEGKIPFVETRNWRRVKDYIDTRRDPGAIWKFGFIEGLTSSQKTECCKHYRDLNNHCKTIHIEAPAKATRNRFIHKLGKAYLMNASWTTARKELELETVVTAERTIIVDNVQRLFRPDVKPDQQPIFNFLHELQDDTECTVIFTWVPTFRKTITAEEPFWRQFLARGGGEDQILKLDQRLIKSDIIGFAKAYQVANDAAAFPILKGWSETSMGVRAFKGRLHLARLLATSRRQKEISVDCLREVENEPLAMQCDQEDAA